MEPNFLENEFDDGDNPNIIHLRIQQRKGNKYITIIEGIPDEYDLKKMLRSWKKNLNCNGTIVEEKNTFVVQLTGDQRSNIAKFLVDEGISNKDRLRIHGATA